MLLLFSGDSAISSDAAATTIQKAGWDRKSTKIVANVTLSLTAYFTSSLLTRFSTWLSLVNISRFVSLMSTCSVLRLAAIFSTALVSLTIAADASSLRRLNPNSPIAATEMEAPSAAARISITALCWCCFESSCNPVEIHGFSSRAALALWLVRVAHRVGLAGLLRFQQLYFHCLNL